MNFRMGWASFPLSKAGGSIRDVRALACDIPGNSKPMTEQGIGLAATKINIQYRSMARRSCVATAFAGCYSAASSEVWPSWAFSLLSRSAAASAITVPGPNTALAPAA